MCFNCLVVGAVLCLANRTISAATIFSDGFESYTAGNAPLDKNIAGANSAPNGSGNPWFGPSPPNLRVVGTTGGVNPIGGSNMVTASAPSDVDQDWVNVAYRFNSGAAYNGGIELSWYFYDPAGQNGQGSNFKDMAGLAYYSSAPSSTDYPGSGSLNGSSTVQRFTLGGADNQSGGYSNTVYQAHVPGSSGGYSGTAYFNTGVARSIGWHHAVLDMSQIVGGACTATFSIDGALAVARPFTGAAGINVIELNDGFGSQPAFYDNVTLSSVPEPGTLALIVLGGLGAVAMLRRRRA